MPRPIDRRQILKGALASGAFLVAGGTGLTACGPSRAGDDSSAKSTAKEKAQQLVAGTPTPKGDLLADTVDQFAKYAAEESDGSITIKNLYMSLGVEAKLTEAVKSGSADIGQLANGNASTFTDALQAFDLPFLFRDNDSLLEALDGPVGRAMLEKFAADLGVRYLFPISNGAGRAIETTKKALKLPSDIKGLKIRVTPSVIDRLTFSAWGAKPTPIDYAQTYSALQQGVVEGEALPLPIIHGNKHFEVVKHALDLSYQSLFANVYINQNRFTGLSSRQQQALTTAADKARAWNYDEARRRTATATSELTAAGMTITSPSDAEYAEWSSIRDSVWQQAADEIKTLDLGQAEELRGSGS